MNSINIRHLGNIVTLWRPSMADMISATGGQHDYRLPHILAEAANAAWDQRDGQRLGEIYAYVQGSDAARWIIAALAQKVAADAVDAAATLADGEALYYIGGQTVMGRDGCQPSNSMILAVGGEDIAAAQSLADSVEEYLAHMMRRP